MRKLAAVLSFILVFGLSAGAYANTAETVPEGIFVLGLKYGYSFANSNFGRDFGTDTRSVVGDYNITITGADLDPTVFSTDDVIGRLDVDYAAHGEEIQFTAAYGITDSLAFMMIMPITHAYQKIDFNLLDSNMHMVRDRNGDPFIIASQSQYESGMYQNLGMKVSDNVLNADEFREVLSCRANTAICRFRYKPIRTYDRWGLGDVIFGGRYRFYQSKMWRQAITVFMKAATGRHKDTDDIVDRNFGDQQLDVGFWYGIDFMPIEPLRFNVSFGYTDQMPDVKEKRVYSRSWDEMGHSAGTIPIGSWDNKIRMHRDIGGNWDLYFGFDWRMWPFLTYGNEFYFFWKYEDNYWSSDKTYGANGVEFTPDFRAMEFGTNQAALEMSNFLSFSTIDWVIKGKFPVPFNISVGYTFGLAGQNFERNHKLWVALDLIGSIFMLESAESSSPENTEDFQLPGRTADNGEGGWQSPVAHRKGPRQFTRDDRTRTLMNMMPSTKLNW